MHEGSTNPRLKQELRSATGLALRAGKVAAQSLGKAMSTGVVQEHHQWLCLVERSDVDKVSFLDTLISKAWLFGDTVEDCAQQFSAVQKQTEATHLAPAWCSAPPQSKTQSACRRGRPPVPSRVREQVSSGSAPCWIISRRVEPHAGAWCPLCSSWPPISSREAMKRPWHRQNRRCGSLLDFRRWRGQRHSSSPRREEGENHSFCFRRWLKGQRYPLYQVRTIPFLRVFRSTGFDSVRRIASSLSPRDPFLPAARECGSGTQYFLPRTSSQSLQGLREFLRGWVRNAGPFCTIQPYSHSLHHCGYVECAWSHLHGVWRRGLRCSPVSLAHAHNSTRLTRFSRQATSQVPAAFSRLAVQARMLLSCARRFAVLLARSNRAGPSSRDEAGVFTAIISSYQGRRWYSTNPGLRLLKPGHARLPFKMLNAQAHDQMHTARDWFAAIDPEGCLLSCFDPSTTQTVLRLRPRVGHGSTGGLPFGLSLSARVFTRSRRVPLPRYGKWASGSFNCLEHGPHARTVMRSQGPGAIGTSASWGFGSTGKRASSPLRRESLFLVWS